MSIVQFSIFPSPSSQCIVYLLILDCTVNHMLDIKLGDVDEKSVKKGGLLGNGTGVGTRRDVLVYDFVHNEVMFSSLILHKRLLESVTVH